jgi:hypothetical protein
VHNGEPGGTMRKITAGRLRTLTEPGVYGDGGGLYLQVRDAERRTWIYHFIPAS